MLILLKIFGSLILLLLSGLSKAVKDTIEHHYLISIFQKLNPKFWNHDLSWVNKYKDGDVLKGSAFWGSTTIFVFLTDAWHLFDTIGALSWQLVLSFWMYLALGLSTWYIILLVIAIKVVYNLAFHFPYTYWFIVKK